MFKKSVPNIREVIEEQLTDEARLAIFGLGEDNVQRLKERITSAYRDVGGNEGYTERDLEDDIREMQQSYLSVTGFKLGAFKARISLEEQFRFSTLPGVQAAARTVDGIGSVIGDMLSIQEELRHGYGMTAKNIAMVGVSAALNARGVVRAIASTGRMLSNAMTTLQNLRRGKALLDVARVFNWRYLAGGVKGILWGVIQMLLAQTVGRVAYRAAHDYFSYRAYRQAVQAVAPQLVDRERLVDDYTAYRSTLVMRQEAREPYEVLESMVVGNSYLGLTADMFGNDYRAAAEMSRRLSLSGRMRQDNFEGYSARAMQLGGLYSTDFTDTFATLSRITLDGDIEEATRHFEEFFSSLVVGGRLHMAQLNLIGGLTTFTEDYVMGARYNIEGGASNLARLQQQVNPMFGYRQTTEVVQELVRGVDSVLELGALGYNPHVSKIMGRMGISSGEALGGLTSSPDMLDRLLEGMYLATGIGYEDFDESGDINDEAGERFIAYTTKGLGMDEATMRSIYPAYRSYVQGARGEDVQREYAEAFSREAAETVIEEELIALTQTWTEGSRALTDIIFQYTDVMLAIDESINELGGEIATLTMPETRRIILGAMGRTEEFRENFRGIEERRARRAEHSPVLEEVGERVISEFVSVAKESGRFVVDDTRFFQLGEEKQTFLARMFSSMARDAGYRITGVGGLPYRTPGINGINVGTDVVLGPAGSQTPIYFPFRSGTVVLAGRRITMRDGTNTYGNSVVVELDGQHAVSFSHLSRISVAVGEEVRYGQLIGLQGDTGWYADGERVSSGEHVDIEFHIGSSLARNNFAYGGGLRDDLATIVGRFSRFLPDDRLRHENEFLRERNREESPESEEVGIDDISDSQKGMDYVNIDVEVNGRDSRELANYYLNGFMTV